MLPQWSHGAIRGAINLNKIELFVISMSTFMETEMSFVCNDCEKQLTAKGNLEQHMKTIHGYQSVYCKECTELFNRKDALTLPVIRKHPPDKTG